MDINYKLAIFTLLAVGITVNTQAAITGKVDVKLDISTGCTVGGSEVEESGNMNKFGSLDFGRTSGTWTNVLTAQVASASGGGHLTVTCDGTEPVNFTVAIDGGERTNRSLKNTASEDFVTYNVFRDSTRTNEYVVNQPHSFSAEGGVSTAIPIYGAIAPNTGEGMATGEYKDTLLVTVDF